jgi:hypothetical protein
VRRHREEAIRAAERSRLVAGLVGLPLVLLLFLHVPKWIGVVYLLVVIAEVPFWFGCLYLKTNTLRRINPMPTAATASPARSIASRRCDESTLL